MRHRFATRLALLALALPALPARAHAEDEEVLVRGHGGAQGGFVSRARLEDSPREITDAASLVEPLPGVHVRRLGADDSFATMSIRGSTSTQVMVYLAGVPLTGGADPTLDLATLPLWPGTEARVYRSFAPASLGRASLGGTLVLLPPNPRRPPATDVWAGVGSFGQRRVRIGDVRGDPDEVRVSTGLSASRSDDDFSYFDPLSRTDRVRENAGHAAANGLVSVALPVRFGERRGALTMTALAQGRKQELPGTITNATPFQSVRSSRLVSALELTVPAAEGTIGLRGWGRREGIALRDSLESTQRTQGPAETDDAILAAGGSAGYKLQAIEVRVDGSAERYAPGTWIGGSRPPGARRTNAGVAMDASTRAGLFTFAASARGDAWIDAAEDGTSTTEARPTGHAGAELALGHVAIATHAGYLARPPSFVERFGNAGGFIGEPDLRPESAATVDLGATYRTKEGLFSIELEGAVFGTWAEDLIVFVPVGAYGRGKAENIGRARLLGLEEALRARLGEVSLRVSHTALSTANGSECLVVRGACERPPLPGRPEHDLVADLAWEHGILRLRYGIDVMSGMRADPRGTVIVPPRVLHGASARVTVARGLTVTFDVRNFFDLRTAEYEGVAGLGGGRRPIGDLFDFPIPGRRFLVTARYTTN